MKITYRLNKEDYLYFQLYTVSQSKRIQRKKLINWLVFGLVSFAFAIYFYYENKSPMTIYFGIVGVVWLLLYKTYFKWRYKRHFDKFITEHYKNRFGKIVELTFNSDHIYSIEEAGEGSIKNKEIEHVAETKLYFFIKMYSGVSLIIPKKEIDNLNTLLLTFQKLNFKLINKSDWKL